MSKLGSKIKSAFSDRDNVLKWGLIGLAGLLGLGANLVDTKIKDKKYERKMDEEIAKQTAKLMAERTTTEG